MKLLGFGGGDASKNAKTAEANSDFKDFAFAKDDYQSENK